MPKQLATLSDYSSRLVSQLPDFLNQTIDHRLKQNAHLRASNASLSPSGGGGLKQMKDMWGSSELKKSRMLRDLNSKRVITLNTSIDASLPSISPLQPKTDRGTKLKNQFFPSITEPDGTVYDMALDSKVQTKVGFNKSDSFTHDTGLN